MSKKIKSEVNNVISIVLALTVLIAVLEIAGTTFFGVDLLPFIVLIIVVVLAVKSLQENEQFLRWVERKLNKLFK